MLIDDEDWDDVWRRIRRAGYLKPKKSMVEGSNVMAEIKFSSDIEVKYIGHTGSDCRIVEAMLVSSHGLDAEKKSKESLEKRIDFLMKNRHGTPFEHGSLTVFVHAPIKVFREWHRHRVPWSYSEESGRYKQLEPLFYIPPKDRPMMRGEGFKSAKPSFSVASEEQYENIVAYLQDSYEYSYRQYEYLLAIGLDRGLARDVLGVGIYSSCFCTANPRGIMHFLELRTNHADAVRPSKPLYEIAVAADQLEMIFSRHWPITYASWVKYGRMAP